MTSGKFDINGYPVWYEKFGTGREVILFIPGAIGTGRSDFKPQIEGPHAFDPKKYTLIAIELPGFGRSRPPKRPYGIEVYNNDCECATKLMENLGYNSYSVIGWSDGAKVAILVTMKNPSKVKCVVGIGVFIYVTKKTIIPTLLTRDTKKWPKDLYENYLPIYGSPSALQLIWDEHINFCKEYCDNRYANAYGEGGYLTDRLHHIRCPILIFHGDKDPMVGMEHPKHCQKHIPDTRVHRFPEGSHNCHQTFAAEFKKVVEKFFDDCDSCY